MKLLSEPGNQPSSRGEWTIVGKNVDFSPIGQGKEEIKKKGDSNSHRVHRSWTTAGACGKAHRSTETTRTKTKWDRREQSKKNPEGERTRCTLAQHRDLLTQKKEVVGSQNGFFRRRLGTVSSGESCRKTWVNILKRGSTKRVKHQGRGTIKGDNNQGPHKKHKAKARPGTNAGYYRRGEVTAHGGGWKGKPKRAK